jgi:hypothetical protein
MRDTARGEMHYIAGDLDLQPLVNPGSEVATSTRPERAQ